MGMGRLAHHGRDRMVSFAEDPPLSRQLAASSHRQSKGLDGFIGGRLGLKSRTAVNILRTQQRPSDKACRIEREDVLHRRVMATAHETVPKRGLAVVKIHLRIECRVLDHLIVAGTGTTSMAARLWGLMIRLGPRSTAHTIAGTG